MARRATPTTPQTHAPGAASVAVVPLTADRWADLAALFEEGGDPKWCWCQFYRERGLDWSNSNADTNRARLRALTEAGPPPGLIALHGDRAVGWISLGPRPAFGRLTHAKVLAPVDDKPVWSIVCFVVSRHARGQGVARELLEGAIAWARDQGATLLEAYPSDTRGRTIPAANLYQGSLSMFEAAGFEVVARRQFNKSTPVRPIVRRDL
jgi:GNAT superfamily N-acetyltransferase